VNSAGLNIEIQSLGGTISGELHPAWIIGHNPYTLGWEAQPLSVTENKRLSWMVSPGNNFKASLKFPGTPYGYLLVIPYGVNPRPGSEAGAWATRSYNTRENLPHLFGN